MGDTFFGFTRVTSSEVGVLPPILGSLEAWKARDGERRVTLVHSRPDIIAFHLAGTSYLSNIDQLDVDLLALGKHAYEPGELRLLEVRRVVDGRIPLGVFEPVDGWPLRDLVGFVRCELPLAAAIALAIARTYTGGPNVIAPDGRLLRQVLPHFSKIWRSEAASFTGSEPDISEQGRDREMHEVFAQVSGAPRGDIAQLARGVDLGPALARTLAVRYSLASPW